MLEPALPRQAPHFRIGHVVMDVRQPLGFGIGRPHALRPSEVRNARFGGNARAGQRHDTLGAIDPLAHRFKVSLRHPAMIRRVLHTSAPAHRARHKILVVVPERSSSLSFALRALRYRNYRLFFGGQVVSLVGTWITTTATNW